MTRLEEKYAHQSPYMDSSTLLNTQEALHTPFAQRADVILIPSSVSGLLLPQVT